MVVRHELTFKVPQRFIQISKYLWLYFLITKHVRFGHHPVTCAVPCKILESLRCTLVLASF